MQGIIVIATGGHVTSDVISCIASKCNCTVVVVDDDQERRQLYELHNMICEDVDLDWWESQQRQIEADKKMRESWKLQNKKHHFHQRKWGSNKPKCRS